MDSRGVGRAGAGPVFVSPLNAHTVSLRVLSPATQRKIRGSQAGPICAAPSPARHSLRLLGPLTGTSANCGTFSQWPAKEGCPGKAAASLPACRFQPRVGSCLGGAAAEESHAWLCVTPRASGGDSTAAGPGPRSWQCVPFAGDWSAGLWAGPVSRSSLTPGKSAWCRGDTREMSVDECVCPRGTVPLSC